MCKTLFSFCLCQHGGPKQRVTGQHDISQGSVATRWNLQPCLTVAFGKLPASSPFLSHKANGTVFCDTLYTPQKSKPSVSQPSTSYANNQLLYEWNYSHEVAKFQANSTICRVHMYLTINLKINDS